MLPADLAGGTASAAIAAGDAGDVKAARADGHSARAEDAANSSGGGGSHHGVLWEGAEDGARQGHHHWGGLDGHGGALALPDTALIAAVGQRAGAAGLAARVAGHGSGSQVHLAQRAGRSRMLGRLRSSTAPKHPAARAPPGPHCTAHLKAQEPPQTSPSLSLHKIFSPLPFCKQKQLPALGSDSPDQLRPPARKELLWKQEEKDWRLPTHLIPEEEEEVREVDARAETWAAFYSSPALPQAQ